MPQLDFIELTNAFKYSINLRYDIGDINKINSFIPTRKNLELFKDIFSSFKKNPISRSRILIGAYGTGKSYFSMILGSILSDKENPDKYDNLLNKIGKIDTNLKENIENEIKNKPPYLLVMPTVNNKSFTQAMLNGLKKSLDRNNINDDVFPKTNFQAVKDKIKQWKEKYPSTYKMFVEKLENERGYSIDDYSRLINNFEYKAYELFEEWYPDLTAGGEFDPYLSSNITDIYTEVNKEIRKLGYKGIFVIYDEFNKLLENNIDSFDGIALQDFAEMASRTDEEEIHLLLISHKELVQYTSDISKKRTEEWKKIEERFKIIESINYSNEIYDLIGSVINKTEGWENFKNKHEKQIENYAYITDQLNIYPSMDFEDIKNKIVENCYPIHPLGVNLLPKLAQRIAQNERTLFTFLSSDETNTLGEFIREEQSEFPLIDLEKIYDYFEELMQQEMDYKSIHDAWANTQIALQKVKEDENHKKKMLKSLAIIKAVNNYSEVSPSREILKFALSHTISENEFNQIFDDLIEKKIILERKSIDQIDFFDASETNVNELIEEKIKQNIDRFNPNYILEQHFNPAPIYPKKYNDEYKMKRYFVGQFIGCDEVLEINNWSSYLKNYNGDGYIDGLVNYVIYDKESKRKDLLNKLKEVDDERVIFIIPENPVKVQDLLKRLDALLLLKKDKKLIEKDKFIQKEINAYVKDIKTSIENELDNKLLISQERTVINGGKIKKSSNNISDLASNICFNAFNKTPKINNELIVRNKITSPQRRARKSVVGELLYNGLSKRLNIFGYGPDYLIYRSFFVATNLIKENNEQVEFNPELFDKTDSNLIDNNLNNILNKLKNDLFDIDIEVSFGSIYDELRDKPYGIRLGVMPLLIAIAGRLNNDIDYSIIKHNGEEREITPQLFEEINRYPDRFSIKKIEWNQYIEDYINSLETKFAKYIDETSSINRLERISTAIKKWLIDLDNYAKECQVGISKKTQLLRRIFLGQQKEAKSLLLEYIPVKLSDQSVVIWDQTLAEELKNIFDDFKAELNTAFNDLKRDLMDKIATDIFGDVEQQNLFSSQFKNSLVSWYRSLSAKTKQNTFNRKANSFLRLLSTLKLNDNSDEKVLQELSMILTGFDLADWNDSIKDQFFDELKRVKDEISGFEEEYSGSDSSKDRIEFTLKDVSGENFSKSFDYQELNGFANILEKNVRGSFKDIGDSVSDAEKQQIAVNILKDIIKNNL